MTRFDFFPLTFKIICRTQIPVFCLQNQYLRKNKQTVIWSRSHRSNRIELGFEYSSLDSESRAPFSIFRMFLPKARGWVIRENTIPPETSWCSKIEHGAWDWGGLSASSLRWPDPLFWFQSSRRKPEVSNWQKPESWVLMWRQKFQEDCVRGD